MPLAVVLEEHVAAAGRGHVEVLVAVVVDIGEGGRDADLARDRHAGRRGDVLEAAAAEIPPQLVAAHLADEVDVGAAVAVDVGNRDPGAVIVVRRLVGLAGVVHDAGLEIDAAFDQAIGELEVVEGGERGRGLDLGGRLLLEPLSVLEISWDVTDRNFLSGYAQAEDGEHSHSYHSPSSHVLISVKSRSIDREARSTTEPTGGAGPQNAIGCNDAFELVHVCPAHDRQQAPALPQSLDNHIDGMIVVGVHKRLG